MNSMREYLSVSIISPDKTQTEGWQGQGIVVPRKGDYVKVRIPLKGDVIFEGEVEDVCWTYRKDHLGVVVSVYLK